MTENEIKKLEEYILKRICEKRRFYFSKNTFIKLRGEDVVTSIQAEYILLCKMLYESELITEEQFRKIFDKIIKE